MALEKEGEGGNEGGMDLCVRLFLRWQDCLF